MQARAIDAGTPSECPPLEAAVVRFILGLSFDDLSEDVRAAVSLLLRDQLAVQIGSSRLPWSRQVLAFAMQRHLPGRSSVTAGAVRTSAADAAFVNAVFGHGFEYDDAHQASASHPGCCVVPAALAIGEELDVALEDVITAIVVGYEVYTRIGTLAAPDLLTRGFHPHAVLANFGAAAVAAKLHKLDAETTLHALSIALSHASGTTEYTSTGGSVKRVHSGIGVKNGMQSAALAKAGITGPRAFLSGNKGFFRTFLQRGAGADAERRFDPAQGFEIEKVWIKPYCCCGCNHAYIDAIRPYAHRLADIESVQLKIQRTANTVVGAANVNAYQPKNIEHIQYSVPVQMAFALHGHGNGYRAHSDYLEGRLEMESVMATARRVGMVEAPELDAAYPGKFVADVTVGFRDGTSEHTFVAGSFGTPDNPMPEADHDAKFLELTCDVIGTDRARTLLGALKRLDPGMRAAELMAICGE